MDIENLKYDYPEMPDYIGDMIRMEVDKEIHKEAKKITGFVKAAAVALTVILGMGGTAYAANKLYNIYIEKEKTYGVNITYASNASDECDVTLTGDSWKGGEIPKVTLSVDYVPKGMVIADGMEDYTENGDNIVQKVIIGNKENPFCSGVSFGFATLNPDVSFELHERYVKEAKEIDVNGNPAVCIEYDEIKNVNTNRTCSLYVFYQELPYVLQMTIFEGTDIDTAVQIAEGLKLTITEDEHAKHLVDAPAYEPVVAEELEEEIPDASSDFVVADAEQMANTHAVGEAFDYKAAVGGTVTAKVSSVTVCDDLSMLDKEVMKYYGMNPEQYQDKNGKLLPDTLQYIKYGDGIDSLDEIVKAEEVEEKLVYIAIDYTNNSDTVKEDILFNLNLTYIKNDDDTYSIVNPLDKIDADDIVSTVYGYKHYADYFYNGNDVEEINHIMNLQPGETQTIYEAFFVPENMLEYMYLNLNGGAIESQQTFEPAALEIGYVDIRQ